MWSWLKTFINAWAYSEKVLIAQAGIHIAFLFSAMAIAMCDRLLARSSGKQGPRTDWPAGLWLELARRAVVCVHEMYVLRLEGGEADAPSPRKERLPGSNKRDPADRAFVAQRRKESR